MPTIAEVAQLAEVSLATVSRVLNNSAPVSDEKRRRVLAAVRELNYRSGGPADDASASDGLGVVVQDPSVPFFGMMLRGIEAVTRASGMQLVIGCGRWREEDERHAVEFLTRNNCSALILQVEQLPEDELIARVREGPPVVLVGRYIPEVAHRCVYVDNELGGMLATQYLIDRGHTRIAHFAGHYHQERDRERTFGYRRALEQAGLPYREDFVVPTPDYTEESGERAAERLLDRDLGITAIFTANDQMAAGVLTALRRRGLSVPEDVSIVGYDDLPMARHLFPELTTVRQPVLELGRAAASLALSHLNSKAEEVIRRFEPNLVERASVRSPSAPDRERTY